MVRRQTLGTKTAHRIAYAVFSVILAAACYLRPSTEDFDRYVYESLIRSTKQPIESVYRIVKHSSLRAEASNVMDSPEHLAQLEPLYAIRPIYIELITSLNQAGLSPQPSINLVSAASLFGIALLLGAATERYMYSAAIMSTSTLLTIGRMGTPDALSSLVVAGGCLAILKEKLFVGILLMMVSIWVRTDNLVLVITLLAWLICTHKLGLIEGGVLAGLGVASVEYINTFSGNYGWKVLFQYSFVGGKYPAELAPQISLAQYAHVFVVNAESLAPQLALWVLLGVVAWNLDVMDRRFLIPVGVACSLHYMLYPSGEARYFTWACLLSAILFVRAVSNRDKGYVN